MYSSRFLFNLFLFALPHFFLDKRCRFHRCSTHTHPGVSGKCLSGLWREGQAEGVMQHAHGLN